MLAALLLAIGTVAPAPDRFLSVNVWLAATLPAAAGPRLGIQLGPFEAYGGFDPISLSAVLDDQVTGYTYPLVLGGRAHLRLPIGFERGDIFAGIEFSGWRETIRRQYDETFRRATGVVGLRWGWGVGLFELAAGMTRWDETRQFSNYAVRSWMPALEMGIGLSF